MKLYVENKEKRNKSRHIFQEPNQFPINKSDLPQPKSPELDPKKPLGFVINQVPAITLRLVI